MARPVILKTGSTYSELARELGDFEDWTAAGMGLERDEVLVVDPGADHLPSPSQIPAVVLTGSHAMVTESPDDGDDVGAWLRALVQEDVPVLGICYGHQLLASALGGEVGYHPGGLEVGTVDVELFPAAHTDALFRGLASHFPAQATHAQTILTLPAEAVPLARTGHDHFAAVRFARTVWGVQFHPEFSERVTAHYVRIQREALVSQGQDADAVRDAVRPSPAGALLRRFADLATGAG